MIAYRPFNAWASNTEWHAGMTRGDDAVCITTGELEPKPVLQEVVDKTNTHCAAQFTNAGYRAHNKLTKLHAAHRPHQMCVAWVKGRL